jgi:heptosyltransferase-3
VTKNSEVVLIFHLGSLGDTAVAIPSYREIARRHATAKLYLLTDASPDSGMVPMAALLQPMGLIDGSISFPMHLRRLRDMRDLRRQIVDLNSKTLYYLTPETRLLALVRHCSFFLACGIKSIRSVPWSATLRNPLEIVPGKLWETEGSRLLRVVGAKTNSDPPPDSERSLNLSDVEHRAAERHLASVRNLGEFIAVSAGGKFALKDWGDENWSHLLGLISARNPTLGLVLVGSAAERERNYGLLRSWHGAALNACGLFSPRETAAAISRAQLFLGHDTATLHLAAATSTQVIGIYCARDLPGKWFSGRPGDVFFFNQPPCFGCLHKEISECPHDRMCMTAHDPLRILNAVEDKLNSSRTSAQLI